MIYDLEVFNQEIDVDFLVNVLFFNFQVKSGGIVFFMFLYF